MPTPAPSPEQTAAQIRITRALSQPGAKGKRGFLLWVAAAYPKKIADAVARAAAKHIPPGGFAGLGYQPRTQWKSATTFSGLGQLTDISVDTVDLTPSVSQAVADATDSGTPNSSWVSDIADAFKSILPALAQTQLQKQQLANAQTVFNMNLQRAANNQPLLKTDPSAYGPVPTVNFGLAGGTQSALLWGLGGIAAVWLVSSVINKRGSHRKH